MKVTSASISDSLPGLENHCSLQGHHAMDEAGLDIHHLAGVLEIARQLGVGTVQLARAKAEVALFQRGILRSALLGPQRGALDFEQVGRVAVGQRLAVFRQFVGDLAVLRGSRPRQSEYAEGAGQQDVSCSLSHVSSNGCCLAGGT